MRLAGANSRALVVNSCAVTGEAVRQTRQAIRRAWREDGDRPIIVTGCAAQLDPHHFAAMPEVARVVGNAEKYRPESFDLARHPGLDPGSGCSSGAPEDRQAPDQVRGDGAFMKQLNVWPMLILLIAVVLIIIWLRPH